MVIEDVLEKAEQLKIDKEATNALVIYFVKRLEAELEDKAHNAPSWAERAAYIDAIKVVNEEYEPIGRR